MIPNTVTALQKIGNGVTTAFPFQNKIFQAQDLAIALIQPTSPPTTYAFQFQSNTQFYNALLGIYATVTNVDVDTGCTVTFSVAPQAAWTVDLRTQVSETQPTSIKNQGQFLPDLHEEAFDRATRLVQDLYRLAYAYSVHGQDNEIIPWPSLPGPASRINSILGFGSTGQLSLFGSTMAYVPVGSYANDSGTVNAMAASVTNLNLAAGSVVYLQAANTNTPAAALTFNANGTGAYPVYDEGGNNIQPGMVVAGSYLALLYIGNGWVIVGRKAALVPPIYLGTSAVQRSNTTATTLDAFLQLTLLAQWPYDFQCYLPMLSATQPGGLAFGMYYSGTLGSACIFSATGRINGVPYASAAIPIVTTQAAGGVNIATVVAGDWLLIKGTLAPTSVGTFGLTWAQNASNALATGFQPGASLILSPAL